jgi:hypothetical protein
MDTDDLTRMAHESLRLAHGAADVLKTELGAACSGCRTEDEWLGYVLRRLGGIAWIRRAGLGFKEPKSVRSCRRGRGCSGI